MRLGLIGTSAIAKEAMTTALKQADWTLQVVYSRTLETAQAFGLQFGVNQFETDLNVFVNREDIDVIYIASPNSLHFEQVCLALRAKKHVIVEKPAFLTVEEWDKAFALAKENNVYLFEAIRTAHESNFKRVRDIVTSFEQIDGAIFHFQQYSSKLAALEKGIIANSLNKTFGGGVLMDLGVYALYAAVSWFGQPTNARYEPQLLENGADIAGFLTLNYPTFSVHMHLGKRNQSYAVSEIFAKNITLSIDNVERVKTIQQYDLKDITTLSEPLSVERMHDEFVFFADVINGKRLDEYTDITAVGRIVSELLTQLRP